MKRIFSLILSIWLVFGLCSCGQKADTSFPADAPTWQEQYDLGIRYLSEGNYEEAILAFTAVIDIDPKNAGALSGRGQAYVLSGETEENLAAALADFEAALAADETLAEAWLGLADVYIRMGEYDKALEVLRDALEKTGDQRIADKIAEVESGNITDSSGNVRRQSTYDADGSLIWYHIYTYDEQGRRTSVTAFDGAGNQTGHVDEAYDAEGNTIVWCNYYGDTGEPWAVEYEYDEFGNRIRQTSHQYPDRPRVLDIKNTYNDAGNLVKVEYYSEGALAGYNTYEYDSDGNRTKEVDYDNDGNIEFYYLNAYDEAGNTVSRDSYNGDGTLNWHLRYIRNEAGEYLGQEMYDAEGNLIRSHMDG